MNDGKDVFTLMQEIGNVPEPEMYRTFNMGVGMVIVCAEADAREISAHLRKRDEQSYLIGRVTEGDREVIMR